MLSIAVLRPVEHSNAQPKAAGGGIAIQGNVTNSQISTGPRGFTPAQMRAGIAAATLPFERFTREQEKTIRELERQLGGSREMMRSIALMFGAGDVPDNQIMEVLVRLAADYRAIKHEIESTNASRETKERARAALAEGQFPTARDLLAAGRYPGAHDLLVAGELEDSVAATARFKITAPVHRQTGWLPGGKVQFLDDWPARNLVSVKIPQLRKLKARADPLVRIHKDAAANLQAAFSDIERRHLLGEIHDWCGGFRESIPRSGITSHAFGLAFDLNCDVEDLEHDQRPGWLAVIKIFKEHGFAWGGDYRYPAPQHFQANRLGAGGSPGSAAPAPQSLH